MARVAAGPFTVNVSDISLAGMMLHSSANEMISLREGDELLMGFPEPDERHQVELKTRIVWKRHGLMALLGAWSFGVVFHDTPEAEIRRLLDPAAAAHDPLPESN
jgi:hypothetical protein